MCNIAGDGTSEKSFCKFQHHEGGAGISSCRPVDLKSPDMSKKKNTLKDLDEFLKQQATSLVSHASVTTPVEEKKVIPPTDYRDHSDGAVTTDAIFLSMRELMQHDPDSFRQKLYALIIQILEAAPDSLPEDKMMINTALYLKSGEHWKEAISEFWRKNPM